MKNFLLLLREENVEFEKLSPQDFDQLMNRFFEWNATLRESGNYITCLKLTDDPGVLAKKNAGRQENEVLDGPFTESREAVVGFYLIRAVGFAEAQKIAADCPVLDYGGSAEVREIFSLFDSPVRNPVSLEN